MKSFAGVVAGMVAVVCLSFSANAGTVTEIPLASGPGLNGLGAYTGSVKYDTAGMLWVSLTNTSPLANGGWITGFVFNIDGNASAAYVPIGGDTFSNLSGASASPFGQFEHGAAIGGDFAGGGSPLSGVAVGDLRTFKFNVTGPDAGSLAAGNFLSEWSTGTGAGEGYQTFVARFQGFNNDGSDKVPTGHLIPTPAAFGAGLSLLAALGLTRRRRS